MPPQDGLRPNHLGHSEQARPEPGHPYEQRAITAAKSKTRWCPPQSDVELMAKKQILCFKPASRLEQIGDEHAERVQHRNIVPNDAMILRYLANLRRMEFSERTGRSS